MQDKNSKVSNISCVKTFLQNKLGSSQNGWCLRIDALYLIPINVYY